MSPLHRLGINSPVLQQFGFSSSTSLETDEKGKSDPENRGNDPESKAASAETSAYAEVAEQKENAVSDGPEGADHKDQSHSHTKLGSIM